jgi:hypothetical protein
MVIERRAEQLIALLVEVVVVILAIVVALEADMVLTQVHPIHPLLPHQETQEDL